MERLLREGLQVYLLLKVTIIKFYGTTEGDWRRSNSQRYLLEVNSPGGGVYESAEIAKKLDTIRKEHDIPMYVSMKTWQLAVATIFLLKQIKSLQQKKQWPAQLVWSCQDWIIQDF